MSQDGKVCKNDRTSQLVIHSSPKRPSGKMKREQYPAADFVEKKRMSAIEALTGTQTGPITTFTPSYKSLS